jgi:Fe-S-cluster containining protein
MAVTGVRTRVRPFLFRPGARYRCFGDGLCCTDIHALGPLTRREVVQIRRLDPRGATRQGGFDAPMLRTGKDGACVFQGADQRCGIHAQFGHAAKPAGCRRFPLGLVATPRGGRVTTDHRCSCRTLGDRPALTAESVTPSLVDDAGRLEADRRVERVSLTRHRHVSMAAYEALEGDLLSRLGAGEDPRRVLPGRPFPALRGSTWRREADVFVQGHDGTQFGVALGWFADAVLALRCRRRGWEPRARPWSAPFARAMARTPQARPADEVLADWLADEVWALRWSDEGWSFDRACAEMATRLAVARWVAARLVGLGLRGDQAAAEGVMVVDMVGSSDYWLDVVRTMRV